MPYAANFIVEQAVDCTTIKVTDTSTNPSSETILDRKIYLQKADGSYLAPTSQQVWVDGTQSGFHFKVRSLPPVSTLIQVRVVDPVNGTIDFDYTMTSGDTSFATLAANIAAAIQSAPYSYDAIYDADSDFVEVKAPVWYGASINYSGSGTGAGYVTIVNVTTLNKTNFSGGVNGYASTVSGLNYYDFSPFLFPSNYINIPIAADYALSVQFVAVPSVVVAGSVYTKTQKVTLLCNLKTFRLGIISQLQGTPNTINDTNFKDSLFGLNTEINDAEIALTDGSDIAGSQASIDRGYYYINNQAKLF